MNARLCECCGKPILKDDLYVRVTYHSKKYGIETADYFHARCDKAFRDPPAAFVGVKE